MEERIEGRYRILRALGQGASGQTYLVHDEVDDVQRVVKELFAEVGAGGAGPWLREARVLEGLDHDRIPRLHASFVAKVRGVARLHLVMDFVDGEPLNLATSRRRPSRDQVLDRVEELLEILAWLQSRSPPVLHRDVKPGNLMVRARDGALVLIDFGLAMDVRHRTFGHTMAAGTLGYQAPEQISGEPVPASDVYSAGVLAWHLLTGEEPGTHLDGQRLEWEADVAGLPAWLRAWLERALAPVEERFASAEEALEALGQGRRTGRVAAAPRREERPMPRRTVERSRPEPAEAPPRPAPSKPRPPARRAAAPPSDMERFPRDVDGVVSVLMPVIFVLIALGGVGWKALSWLGERSAPPPINQPVAVEVDCEGGNGEACYAEARAAVDRTPPAVDEALKLAERGCGLGSGDACWFLSDTFDRGTWRPRELELAIRWTTEACALNVTNSCDRLSQLVGELPEAEARVAIDGVTARLGERCKEAVPQPGTPLWRCTGPIWWLERDLPYVGKQFDEAVPFARLLCEAGTTSYCLHLAWLHDEAAPGHHDPEEALRLYTQACTVFSGKPAAGQELPDYQWERFRSQACQGMARLGG